MKATKMKIDVKTLSTAAAKTVVADMLKIGVLKNSGKVRRKTYVLKSSSFFLKNTSRRLLLCGP